MILPLALPVLVTVGASNNCAVGRRGSGPLDCRLGRGSLAAGFDIFGQDEENVLLPLALIGSQSANRMLRLITQRNADHNGGIIEDGGHSRAVLGAGQEDFGRPTGLVKTDGRRQRHIADHDRLGDGLAPARETPAVRSQLTPIHSLFLVRC